MLKNADIIKNAIETLRSDEGENVEYDRALLELYNFIAGTDYETLDELNVEAE